ncbi:MAG: FAA hydrolase family protein [Bacteroidetes bacterium]|nr:MAG: FAA hydrolase family protein [Bacteroidota bacterium]
MKIICIGRNYRDHAKELNNDIPTEPVIFLKPDTAVLKDGQDFYLPDLFQEVHHEVELLVRIDRHGKNIQSKFAHKYYTQIGLGIDFTARDKQSELKSKGLPWELAKAFDGSAFISSWHAKEDFGDLMNLEFSLTKNGAMAQKGTSADMLFSIDEMIAFVSQYFTLRTGDILFTGTPAGVSAVQKGDELEGFIQNQKLFTLRVK